MCTGVLPAWICVCLVPTQRILSSMELKLGVVGRYHVYLGTEHGFSTREQMFLTTEHHRIPSLFGTRDSTVKSSRCRAFKPGCCLEAAWPQGHFGKKFCHDYSTGSSIGPSPC